MDETNTIDEILKWKSGDSRMTTEILLKTMSDLANAQREAHDAHPQEGEYASHIAGQQKDECSFCKAIVEKSDKLFEFEKEWLGYTRLDNRTLDKTVSLIKSIVLILKNSGEL